MQGHIPKYTLTLTHKPILEFRISNSPHGGRKPENHTLQTPHRLAPCHPYYNTALVTLYQSWWWKNSDILLLYVTPTKANACVLFFMPCTTSLPKSLGSSIETQGFSSCSLALLHAENCRFRERPSGHIDGASSAKFKKELLPFIPGEKSHSVALKFYKVSCTSLAVSLFPI